MRQITRRIGAAVMAAGVCLVGVQSDGSIIFDEQFNYADGGLNGVGGWAGNTGVNVVGGVASHPGVDGDINLSITGQNSGVVYLAMSAQQGNDAPADGSFGGLGLFEGGGEKFLIGKTWGVTDEWSVAGPGVPQTLSGVDSSTGAMQTVLTKIDIDGGLVEMWVLDNGETGPSGAADASAVLSFGFDELRLRGGNGGETNFQFDWIRVATSAEEAVTGVPEPASLGLLCLGGLAILGRRK